MSERGDALPDQARGGGFEYVACLPAPSAAQCALVRAFWQREAAIDDLRQAEARLREVAMYALGSDGEVVAVCTAKPLLAPRLRQTVYYWRAFVGANHRGRLLSKNLLKRSCELLETWAREHDWPCIGVLLELENAQFHDHARRAVWFDPPFVYIGKSARGLDVRVRYFRGALLKPEPGLT